MRSRTRSSFVALALLAGLGAAGCGDDADSEAGDVPETTRVDAAEVQVDDNFFEPEAVDVDVDATVTWTWVGNEPHNVVGDEFESDIQQDGTFEHTFSTAGSFDYVCTVHPGMEGTIEVSG